MQTWHRKIQSYSKPNKTADTQSENSERLCVYALAYACDLSVDGNMCVLHMLLIFYSKAKTTTKNYGIEGVKPYPNPFYASDFQYFVSGCCATAALWCDIPPMVQHFFPPSPAMNIINIFTLSLAPFSHNSNVYGIWLWRYIRLAHRTATHIIWKFKGVRVLWVISNSKREASKLNILEYTIHNATIV